MLEKNSQLATTAAQTPDSNKRKRRRKRPGLSSGISSLSHSAKMPRFEHTFADGSQCQKRRLPNSLIERDLRQFIAEVTVQKVYSPGTKQRRHQRSEIPDFIWLAAYRQAIKD